MSHEALEQLATVDLLKEAVGDIRMAQQWLAIDYRGAYRSDIAAALKNIRKVIRDLEDKQCQST